MSTMPMATDIEQLFKPASQLSAPELAQLKAKISEYKRSGAIVEQGPFDTRKFIDVNNDTVTKVAQVLGSYAVVKSR